MNMFDAHLSVFRIPLIAAAITIGATTTQALAQVPLSSYADSQGYVDVQKLTCAQLANTWQEDADLLAAWYSGWYNGLAKAQRANISRIKDDENLVNVYCKANPEKKIIQAIDVVFKRKK
jgi:predicted deacetylase